MDSIVYFPYINVPDTTWTTYSLLYWDRIHCIVPQEFIDNPDRLSEPMLELVAAGLIAQEVPAQRSAWGRHFLDRFAEHLDRLSPEERERRVASYAAGHVDPVHGDKIDFLIRDLVKMGLAGRIEHEHALCLLESRTALEFMAAFASQIAKDLDEDASPVTDDPVNLSELMEGTLAAADRTGSLAAARLELLEDVLPLPAERISAQKLADFKQKYGDKLPAFRREVEQKLLGLLSMEDAGKRQYGLKVLKRDLRDRTAEVAADIERDTGPGTWVRKIAGEGLSIAGIPGSGILSYLGDKILPGSRTPPSDKLLYAAYAKNMLDKQRRRAKEFAPSLGQFQRAEPRWELGVPPVGVRQHEHDA